MPDNKIDGPTEADFSREIFINVPSGKGHKSLVYKLGAAYILGKAVQSVIKRK